MSNYDSDADSSQGDKREEQQEICVNWLLYGKNCYFLRKKNKCTRRHYINDTDIPSISYSKHSQIIYRILKCRDVNKYKIRVLEHRAKANHKWSSQSAVLLKKFEKSYQPNPGRPPKPPLTKFQNNAWAAVIYEGCPRRVQVLEYNMPDQRARLKFVDFEGDYVCPMDEVLYLTDEYRATHEMDMLIGGLVPCQGYTSFHKWSVSEAEKLLKIDQHNDYIDYESNVLVHLNKFLIVDDIKMIEKKFDNVSHHQRHFSFKTKILKTHAMEDKTVMEAVLASHKDLGKYCRFARCLFAM